MSDNVITTFKNLADTDRVDIILHTNGGDLGPVKLICNIISDFDGKVNIYVPTKAYSGGTMIALSGKKLYANTYTHFSPVDIQILVHCL